MLTRLQTLSIIKKYFVYDDTTVLKNLIDATNIYHSKIEISSWRTPQKKAIHIITYYSNNNKPLNSMQINLDKLLKTLELKPGYKDKYHQELLPYVSKEDRAKIRNAIEKSNGSTAALQ